MKNLTIVLFISIVISSCHPGGSNNNANKEIKRISSSGISLNGIDLITAQNMINFFYANRKNDVNPLPVSVHFTRSEIESMVKLLHTEINADVPGRKDPIDGIRVYFASTNEMQNGHLQTTVILVSTRAREGNKHTDYYQHADSILIPIRNLRNTDNCSGGAVLYSTCTGNGCADDLKCDWKKPHYYKRGESEKMVQNFGKDTINTISEWYDLAMFDDMLKYSFDGVRIYFARHLPSADTTISNRDAFIITTTTYNNAISNYKDFFDCAILTAIAGHQKSGEHLENELLVPAQDNGQLCPANCN